MTQQQVARPDAVRADASTPSRRSHPTLSRVVVLLTLALVTVATVVSMVVRSRRHHDGWVVAVAVIGVIVLVLPLGWLMTTLWSRRAARLRREHPDAWVKPMTWGRSMALLYLDASDVKLLGLWGQARRSYPRADLVDAGTGPIRFPAATRTGLRLRFRNGDELALLTTRRAGFASTVPDAHSACDYLGFGAGAQEPAR